MCTKSTSWVPDELSIQNMRWEIFNRAKTQIVSPESRYFRDSWTSQYCEYTSASATWYSVCSYSFYCDCVKPYHRDDLGERDLYTVWYRCCAAHTSNRAHINSSSVVGAHNSSLEITIKFSSNSVVISLSWCFLA